MPGSPGPPGAQQHKFSRIGIIGDVHAEHGHLQAAIGHLHSLGAEILICTGDIADGRGSLDHCVELLQAHQVVTVRGNHDRWLLEDKARHVPDAHHRQDISANSLDYLRSLPTQVQVDTSYGKLLLCHGMGDNDLQKIWPGTERMPIERCALLDQIIDNGEVRIIVNGHVHYRTLMHFQNLLLLNAGTLKEVHRPGFGLLDLQQQQVIGFEFSPRIQAVRHHPLAAGKTTQIFNNTQHFSGNWSPVTLYS